MSAAASRGDDQVEISFAIPGDEMRLAELTFETFLADKTSLIAKFMFVPSDEDSTLQDEIKKHGSRIAKLYGQKEKSTRQGKHQG